MAVDQQRRRAIRSDDVRHNYFILVVTVGSQALSARTLQEACRGITEDVHDTLVGVFHFLRNCMCHSHLNETHLTDGTVVSDRLCRIVLDLVL